MKYIDKKLIISKPLVYVLFAWEPEFKSDNTAEMAGLNSLIFLALTSLEYTSSATGNYGITQEMSGKLPPKRDQEPVAGDGDKPVPMVMTKRDLKLKSCRFLIEYAFWDALETICLAESITPDEFVSSQIRLKIIQDIYRKSSLRLVRRTRTANVVPAERSFEPKKSISSSVEPLVAPLQNDGTSSHALNVLVVDDVLMSREIAASFLRAAKHNVTCVESGAAAIDAVKAIDFDVVLMDVRMPEMDGLEATRHIRALEGKPRFVPIIALTALAFPEQVAGCYLVGMDSHLPKPFGPETLQAAVLRVTAAQSQRSANLCSKSAASGASSSVIGSDVLAFNKRVFARTARHITPETVTSYLETISRQGEALLRGLEDPNALIHGDEIGEAATTLAGSAGMLGFERLTVVSRQFDWALREATADVPALAEGLSAALSATLRKIEDLVPVAADI